MVQALVCKSKDVGSIPTLASMLNALVRVIAPVAQKDRANVF